MLDALGRGFVIRLCGRQPPRRKRMVERSSIKKFVVISRTIASGNDYSPRYTVPSCVDVI
jgi:hypothetical protein